MTGTDPVLYERGGPVGRLVLNRPAKLNALDGAMLGLLAAILRDAEDDPSLRVLTVTGAGPAFCAGADLSALDGDGRAAFLDLLAGTMAALRAFPKPLVGALNGTTAAAGLEIALRCDLLLASAGARIGDVHVRHGLVPGAGSATLLPGRIGEGRARRMLLTGALEDAETLHAWGLIDWVVAPDVLADRTEAVAADLAGLEPAALRSLKAVLADPAVDLRLRRENAAMRSHLEGPAARRGLAAFRDGRRREPDPGAPPDA